MGTDHRNEEPLNPAAAAEETGTTGGQTESEGDQTGETTNNSNQSGGQGTGDADAGGEGEPETAAGDHPKEPDQSAPEQSDMTDVAAEPQDSSGGDENEGQDAPTPTFTEIIDDDEVTPKDLLGFDPDDCEHVVGEMGRRADELAQLVDVNTVNVHEDFDEDDFFSGPKGISTLVDRYDLEKAVPPEKKGHFEEEQRYWVNKPYAFVIIFHSTRENEKKYYLIEPHFNSVEEDLKEFLSGKLRTAIKYADDEVATGGDEETRRQIIVREAMELLRRYDLYDGPRPMAQPMEDTDPDSGGVTNRIRKLLASITDRLPIGGEGTEDESQLDRESQKSSTDHTTGKTAETETGVIHTIRQSILEPLGIDLGGEPPSPTGDGVRPEQAVTGGQQDTLTESQVRKLLYVLKRNFIGYERIDGIKHDINVEDISCDGYNSPVFVYHTDYEQIITNVYHGEEELDTFVVKLAQRSGKGISKRQPQVDATLPDGSRAQLTLGREVSDHGTNYTIRQFKDVPFTPIDLINWKTFSLEQMAFLWLCIENHKSLLFAGGTASGKTTSLNAVSLFIPSNAKIVSIEDTREVELPQRNWIASVTRPSFSDDEKGDVDEFDLLEAALRQRPDYIVMGEVRGEEGRTLFQVMSTGHTTYTTFHADSVGEVLKRFTTDPINVSKTMFTALDLVSIQSQTRVQGQKVRRNKELTEVNHYDAENDQINVKRVYQWQAETDEFLQMGSSSTLEDIKFDRGWSQEQLETELFKRRVILAYLIRNDIKEYSKVAATLQAFINDPDTILTLVARGELESRLDALREMESVLIQVDPETEAMVPRPDPDEPGYETALDILERAEAELFEEYREEEPDDLEAVLQEVVESSNPTPQSPESPETTEGVDEGPIVDPTATDATDIGAMETNGRGDMEPAGPEADPEMTDRDPSGADGETTGPDHDEADTTTVVTATTSDTDDTGTAATEEQVLPAELQALDGLGQAYANRLKQAGVSSPAELLAVDIDQLSAETDIATPRIEAWIEQLETAKDDEDT